MNIKCPNCGAVHSLDTLINDADASAVLKAVLDMDAELGKAAIRYIGLFRPAKSQLSWSRTAKLLNELMPSIKAATVERDGVSYPAPAAAWIHGFTETLAARDAGRLKTPLKSHGYLKALQDTQEWPNVIELIRALPPRLIPRSMLAKPQTDRTKGREELAKVRQTLNRKGSEK